MYTLEPSRRGGSNEYPQSMFWGKRKKTGLCKGIPIFLIIPQIIDCGYLLEPHRLWVLTGNLNLCFGAQMIKIDIPLHNPVSL